LISAHELLARFLGTKPIHVSLAADAFTFSCGDIRFHVTPQVWLDRAGTIVATGDQPSQAGVEPLNVTSAHGGVIPSAVRQKILEAILSLGFKALAPLATIQRPEVVFHNDAVLAAWFEGRQREALRQAVAATGGAGSRFA
jgi:hypothetical protein